jgi:hypothetical protein
MVSPKVRALARECVCLANPQGVWQINRESLLYTIDLARAPRILLTLHQVVGNMHLHVCRIQRVQSVLCVSLSTSNVDCGKPVTVLDWSLGHVKEDLAKNIIVMSHDGYYRRLFPLSI